MKSNYKRLGDYIRQVDVRNKDDERYDLLGVSVEKCFISSIANTVGTDWHNYKIIKKGQFCYIPDTSRRGDKIGIAHLTDREIGLVSAVYTVFEVWNKELVPEYLMLWFKRPEFDRYARYHSHGSVREIFDWEEMCNVELPVPPIEEQEKIVDAYQKIEKRIALKRKLNDNLEAQIHTHYKELFLSTTDLLRDLPYNWELKQLKDCGLDISDGNYSTKYPRYSEFQKSGIPFVRGTDFKGKYISTKNVLYISLKKHRELLKGHTKKNDILMSTRGEIGKIAFIPDNLVDCNINSQLVRLNGNGVIPRVYLAFSLLSQPVRDEIKSLITGSVQEQLPIGKLLEIHLLIPDNATLNRFVRCSEPILDTILKNEQEVASLENLSIIILETISSR